MLSGKLSAARRGETVEPRAAIVRRCAPLGRYPAFLEQTLESRIKRTMLDFEGLAGGLLDELGDAVPVHGAPTQGTKDNQIEGSLHDLQASGL